MGIKDKDSKHKRESRASESPNTREARLQQEREQEHNRGEARRERNRRYYMSHSTVRFASQACTKRHRGIGCASELAEHWPDYHYHGTMGKSAAGVELICEFCQALLFEGEKSNECCMYGAVKLEPLPDAPAMIKFLLDEGNITTMAKDFRARFNVYNNALSFGSLHTNRRMPPGRGPPIVMINGQLSQHIGNLRPGGGRDPLFLQVYVLDDITEAVENRLRAFRTNAPLDQGLVRTLEELIRRLNPFAADLQNLGRRMRLAAEGQETGLPPPEHFRLSILDKRIAPGQVCAVFTAVDNQLPDPSLSGIWIRAEGTQLRDIDNWNRNADWLLFPLMFPHGTQTYGRSILRHPDLANLDDASGVEMDVADPLGQLARDVHVHRPDVSCKDVN